jgi:hypothetical protein
MASQTKVEPSDSTPPAAPASGVEASTRAEPELVVDAAEPTSGAAAVLSGDDGQPGDDEDVSLDELMMSGEEDEDDEPDETTDAQGVFMRPAPSIAEAAAPASEPAAVEATDREASGALDGLTAFAVDSPEEDEAAARAAAAAAQEAAAQAAAAEADARRTAELVARVAPVAPELGSASALEPGGGAPPELEESPAIAPYATISLSAAPDAAASASARADDLEPPMSVELEPPSAASPLAARGDAPLPSFEIPEAEAPAVTATVAAEAPSRRTPRPMAALPQLSEVAEDDDDDAVTHIGLPVVPESQAEYGGIGAPAFSVAEPGVASRPGFEAELSLTDARRATTRVLPRIDPAELERRRLASDPVASPGRRREALGTWLSGVFQRQRRQPAAAGAQPPRHRAGWVLDTVLPPLSLVLFGSGIGAGIMLLQPDRGANAAQQTQTVQALRDMQKKPVTLAERAEAGDGDALFKVTNMAPSERTSALTLALERGYQAQRQNEFKEFARALDAPSGLATPNLTTRFLSYATSPETMLAAFSHLLSWPGTVGPDVLYNVWEKAPGGSRAASLAQQLLASEDQRVKATPALITALDLRSATSCEDYLRVLPAVKKSGDQRCSATLRALRHKDGCGDDGKQDCFACLRDGSLLDEALSAIESRSAPQL